MFVAENRQMAYLTIQTISIIFNLRFRLLRLYFTISEPVDLIHAHHHMTKIRSMTFLLP